MTLFNDYLLTQHWQDIEAKAVMGAHCCKCGEEHSKQFPLMARHKTYERIGQEELADLETICQLCEGIWPQPGLSDKDMALCDPHGWAAYHIIASQDWGEFEGDVWNAWFEHRTIDAARYEYKLATQRKRRRKYADPESPSLGVDELV